jgi:protein-S-isoprenylcysteine O-methyltransferase Ste14
MMSDDRVIRLVLIGIFLVLLPIGIYQRMQAEGSGEPLDRRQEGLFILVTLRLLGFACWLAVILWLINPRWMMWSSLPVPITARWMGVFLVASGAALTGWTLRSLGRNLTDTVVTRQSHTLVFHGPYRWVRHPLYLAVLTLTTGLSLATANGFFFVMGLAIFTLIAIRTSIEERNLVARFGAEYRAYMDRTGRFFPRLH